MIALAKPNLLGLQCLFHFCIQTTSAKRHICRGRSGITLTLPVRESSSKNRFAWRLKSAYNRSASRSIHLSQKEKETQEGSKKETQEEGDSQNRIRDGGPKCSSKASTENDGAQDVSDLLKHFADRC